MAKDQSALGIITETGSFISTDFPLDPSLEHRVRTAQIQVGERDSDGEFRPTKTVQVVRDRGGNLIEEVDPDKHDRETQLKAATVPLEWWNDRGSDEGDDEDLRVETRKPTKTSKKSKKVVSDDEGLEDQGD